MAGLLGRPVSYSLLGDKPKRKPVKTSIRKKLRRSQGGRCHKCHESFKEMGVRAIPHHITLNAANSRASNIILVCPNCHDKIHQRQKKVRKKVSGGLLGNRYKVVVVGRRKKARKKITRRKSRSSGGLFGISSRSIWG